jgi:hypothetical protein
MSKVRVTAEALQDVYPIQVSVILYCSYLMIKYTRLLRIHLSNELAASSFPALLRGSDAMKMINIAFAAAGILAVAGSASAAVTDLEYLKANRCRGLAAAEVASVDTAAMDAFLKVEGRTRNSEVIRRGQVEHDKAKRQARNSSAEHRALLVAELNGPCQAYKA